MSIGSQSATLSGSGTPVPPRPIPRFGMQPGSLPSKDWNPESASPGSSLSTPPLTAGPTSVPIIQILGRRQNFNVQDDSARNQPQVIDLLSRRPRPPAPESQPGLRGVIAAFVKSCDRWNLGRDERLALLGCPPRDPLGDALLDGGLQTSSQDIRERAGYVVGICVTLAGLFDREIEGELDWLRRPHHALQSKSPLDYMLQRRMKHLVHVSEVLRRERGL